MKFWFRHRIYDTKIDLQPGEWKLEGPYDSSVEAQFVISDLRAQDVEISAVITADSGSEAMKILTNL